MVEDNIFVVATAQDTFTTAQVGVISSVSVSITEDIINATVSQVNTIITTGSGNSFFPNGW